VEEGDRVEGLTTHLLGQFVYHSFPRGEAVGAAPSQNNTVLRGKEQTAMIAAGVERLNGLSTGFVAAIRAIVLSSWLNALLLVVPLAIASYVAHAPPTVIFTANVIAIIPLSALLTYATENISRESGDALGASINVTFGNLVEIVILYVFIQFRPGSSSRIDI
jgi:cobalamin synthase